MNPGTNEPYRMLRIFSRPSPSADQTLPPYEPKLKGAFLIPPHDPADDALNDRVFAVDRAHARIRRLQTHAALLAVIALERRTFIMQESHHDITVAGIKVALDDDVIAIQDAVVFH